jgi:DNA-binding NarL/FixJ family response regulator
MKRKIKIMLVEDNPAYRKVIDQTLKDDPDMEINSQFGTAEIALRNVENPLIRDAPDVVLLDLNLPGMSGLEAIPWFQKYVPKTKIMVLTQSNKEADVLAAISAGASGYLLKSATLDQLQDSIRTVISGGASVDPDVATFILNALKLRAPQSGNELNLTARELEVLTLISEGFVKKEVAVQLGISPKTVSIHTSHIYEKLNVCNAPAAINKAHRLGLFRMGP